MKLSITRKSLALASGFIFLFTLSVMPMPAQAHDGEVHLPEDATEVEKMQKLIEILEQLVALLQQQAGIQSEHADSDDQYPEELTIRAETHAGDTHVHVGYPDKDEVSFWLDAFEITDKAGIIAEIAAREGITEEEVEAAITFPSEETGHDHENMVEATGELEGIHIMADGTVMLGSGETVDDATVNEDGMIVLADGTMVEPVIDMRDGGSMDDMEEDGHDDHDAE